MKVGRVAIITRGRYAGKKVRLDFPYYYPAGKKRRMEWFKLMEMDA